MKPPNRRRRIARAVLIGPALLAIPLLIFFNPGLQQLNSALVMGNTRLPLRRTFE